MHGLINKSLEVFVRETYGLEKWQMIAVQADVPEGAFESMLTYPDDVTDRVLETALRVLDKERDGFLEDLGTFLVSHHSVEALRRLLRFNGATFHGFVDALDDLHGRSRLAVPGLDMPMLDVDPDGRNAFRVRCTWHRDYGLPVILGVLRAMADDYGVLAFFETNEDEDEPCINVTLLDQEFSEGREFSLGGITR